MDDEVLRTGKSGNIRIQLDRLRLETKTNVSYWMGRDIMQILGYSRWENFQNVILKAMQACELSGHIVSQQFRETTKPVSGGSGSTQNIQDYFLTRYACFLIAMSGDTAKPEVSEAQTYFAVQTRKQEIQDDQTDDEKRLALRDRVRNANRKLNGVAKDAGVHRFAIFNDAGYKGLYGGLGASDIKASKGIPATDDLLDRCGRAELAMNEFRITQTEEKLVRDRTRDERSAIDVHHGVGAEVRATVRKLGGTMPEVLKPEISIKKIVAARKRIAKQSASAVKKTTKKAPKG